MRSLGSYVRSGNALRDDRFQMHPCICLLLDDPLERSFQFILEPAGFKAQGGLSEQIAWDKTSQQFRAESLALGVVDDLTVVLLPSEAKQPA